MKKRFYIEAKCLKVSANFFMNFTFKELNNWLSKNEYDVVGSKWGKNILGLYFVQGNNNGYTYGIWIREFSLNRNSISTLVHELHHIVEAQSEEKNFTCKETKAYLIEYYLNEVLKKFKFN